MKPRIFNGSKWIEFDDQAAHDQYISELSQQHTEQDFKQIVINRIDLGKSVLIEYLADNAKVNLTMEQSIAQLQKFQVVKAFLEVGNIDDSIVMISQTPTDEIFTQERKEKYLMMLSQ